MSDDDTRAKALLAAFVAGKIDTDGLIGVLEANPNVKEAINRCAGKLQTAAEKALANLPVTITAGLGARL